MSRPIDRIPVRAGPRLVEMADPVRVQALLRAPNVRPLLYQKRIVGLEVFEHGDDWRLPFKWGRPQKLSTNLESEDNPRGAWKFKRLPQIKEAASLH